MIVIDPRYTDTAAGREDDRSPIRPGTDAASGGRYRLVLINEDLVDQPSLDKYCVGYDEGNAPGRGAGEWSLQSLYPRRGRRRDRKTPQWACVLPVSPPSASLSWRAKSRMSKPAYIAAGWGPSAGPTANLTARAIAVLPILTGNVGINGGNSGARESTYTITIERLPGAGKPGEDRHLLL